MKIGFLIVSLFLLFSQQNVFAQKSNAKSKIDSNLITIKLQKKTTYAFPEQGVYFTNNFASARLNKVEKQNDSSFTLTIEAENRPINSSSWYAFKVWGNHKKNIYLTLQYPDDKHRYKPKLSIDGINWRNAEKIETNGSRFKLQLTPDTLLVSAQELISSESTYRWINDVVSRTSLQQKTIGFSIGKKPIIALSAKAATGKKMVVVLSRQHPPEVSGYMAMQEFVETLMGETELAKKFRDEFELVVVPMLNPDGVDEGNWRHSFAGVDLNRDWIDFKQPETRAVRDYLLEKVKSQQAKVYFAIDFHSTYSDVLYTNENRADSNLPGLTDQWIGALHEFEGIKKTEVKPSGNGGNVSKAWMGKALNAEALTYEVGDDTPRKLLKQKAKKVAEIMMIALLAADTSK